MPQAIDKYGHPMKADLSLLEMVAEVRKSQERLLEQMTEITKIIEGKNNGNKILQ